MSEKIKNIVTVLLAAVFLFGFSVWSLLLPDAEESTSERRHLAQFPAVSASSILSGKFMTAFEDWSLRPSAACLFLSVSKNSATSFETETVPSPYLTMVFPK